MGHLADTPAQALLLGTSGWAYASWKPGFYAAKVPAKDFLKAYSERLNSVEVNYTFRQLPSAKMLENWLTATPEGFRFSFKAPQRITHILRLRGCEGELESFANALMPVEAAGRMGAILLQFPPNFKAMKPGKDKRTNLEALEEFLCGSEKWRGRLRMAFEFRDASWFCDGMYALLRSHGAALCVAESDDLVTPEVRTAEFAYYRLRLGGYSEAQMTETYAKLEAATAQGAVYAYFKHEEAPDGPLRAEELLQRWNMQHGTDVGQSGPR